MAEEHRSDIENAGCASALEGALAAARQEPDEIQLRREARRRILAGGLAGAPLVLTLTSRSAFAGHCSPSGTISGNLSNGHEVECEGKTPGFWKTHEQQVSQYVYPGTCNPINEERGQCDDYSVATIEELGPYLEELQKDPQKNAWKITQVEEYLEQLATYPDPDWFFGTLFSEVFGGGFTENADTTMMQALWLDDTPPFPPDGVGGPSPVLAHSAAAWFNANAFGKEAYGLSPEEVVELVQSLMLTDPITLKDTLEMLNSRS